MVLGARSNRLRSDGECSGASCAADAVNASQFGLSGNVWTKDIALARKMARDLYTGGVFINGVTALDPSRAGRQRQEQRVWPKTLAFWPACFCKCPNCPDRELLSKLSRLRVVSRTVLASALKAARVETSWKQMSKTWTQNMQSVRDASMRQRTRIPVLAHIA